MSQYFPKPRRNFGGNINVKVDLANYEQESILIILHYNQIYLV